MRTAEFDFKLPTDLIAQHPLEPREHSRLMVVERGSGRITHHRFDQLPELLHPSDILARNKTWVIPARLVGRREATGGKWEGLFLRDCGNGCWEMLALTRGRPVPGEFVVVGQGLRLSLESREEAGHWFVRPVCEETQRHSTITESLLEQHGQTPLPPYIRKGKASAADSSSYQTVYAQIPGSVAAPTAGLHFSDAIFTKLASRGIDWVDLTLHIGIGTFRPIEAEYLSEHVIHAEWAELSDQEAKRLNERRSTGGRVVAIGTTSARTLETAAATGTIKAISGHTNLFIQPGHCFRGLDALITNFHLPRSSLLVLVSAFGGVDLIREAYQEAIKDRYRFFSFGDAMLIV